MKQRLRKLAALGAMGIMLGSTGSIFLGAGTANARLIRGGCDQIADRAETSYAKMLRKGQITQDQYDQLMASVTAHRAQYDC